MPKGVPDIHITNPLKENQIYLGIRQEGKTNLLAYHLSLTGCPYTIFDTVGALRTMLKPRYPPVQKIVNPTGLKPDERLQLFHRVCNSVMIRGNQLLVVDEVHQFCDKRWIDPLLSDIVTLGGNRNVAFIGTSQTVRQVSNVILGNTRHFWVMRTFLKPDVDWLSCFIPKEYVQLSKDLPPHGYIYYMLGGKPLVCKAVKKMTL
jgi:hypothetical protein